VNRFISAIALVLLPCALLAQPTNWWGDDVETALKRAKDNRAELEKALNGVPKDQRTGMMFLVANMPDSDLLRFEPNLTRRIGLRCRPCPQCWAPAGESIRKPSRSGFRTSAEVPHWTSSGWGVATSAGPIESMSTRRPAGEGSSTYWAAFTSSTTSTSTAFSRCLSGVDSLCRSCEAMVARLPLTAGGRNGLRRQAVARAARTRIEQGPQSL